MKKNIGIVSIKIICRVKTDIICNLLLIQSIYMVLDVLIKKVITLMKYEENILNLANL